MEGLRQRTKQHEAEGEVEGELIERGILSVKWCELSKRDWSKRATLTTIVIPQDSEGTAGHMLLILNVRIKLTSRAGTRDTPVARGKCPFQRDRREGAHGVAGAQYGDVSPAQSISTTSQLTGSTIYTAAWTPSSVISIVCLIQTVLSCFQLMPLSLEWQSDWPDRTRYQATNTMLQFLPSLLFTIASSKWEFLAICVSMSIALACYIQHDQEKKAEAALLDLERLKYDLKGA